MLGAHDDVAAANEKASLFLRTFKRPEELMDHLAEMLDARLAQSRADSAAAVATTRWVFIGVCLVGALLILLMAVATFRSVVHPLLAMTAAMGRLAGGDKTADVPALERRDEIGGMAKAVEVFKANLIERERLETAARADEERKRAEAEERLRIERIAAEEISDLVKSAASGDFSKRIDLTGKSGFFHALAGGLDDSLARSERPWTNSSS